jgi:hypothetical protein
MLSQQAAPEKKESAAKQMAAFGAARIAALA